MLNEVGISTACFYPELTEKAFDIICGLDVRACEIFINTGSETKPGYLRDIKLKALDNNIRISAVHPYFSGYEGFLFFSAYHKRRILDGIELYKPMFEAARLLGADYVIFHGAGPAQVKSPLEEYGERLSMIASAAKAHGCELLHENVGTVNDFLQDLRDIRFALDFKHSVSRGYDNLEIIGKMGANIAHVHVNDMLDGADKVKSCRLPFAGSLDYKKIFGRLRDVNYIGDFIIEVYSHNYKNTAEISESITKFRRFLREELY